MKIELIITTCPPSFDAEDEISNVLQEDGLREELEVIIEQGIETIMGWQDLKARVGVRV